MFHFLFIIDTQVRRLRQIIFRRVSPCKYRLEPYNGNFDAVDADDISIKLLDQFVVKKRNKKKKKGDVCSLRTLERIITDTKFYCTGLSRLPLFFESIGTILTVHVLYKGDIRISRYPR